MNDAYFRAVSPGASVLTSDGTEGWDAYAAFYDWENARTLGRRDVAFWRELAVEEKARTLELGCGTGRLLAPIARAGVDIVGIDRSEPMLAHARRRLVRVPVRDRPDLLQGDIRHLPFCSGQFGLVIAGYGILQSLVSDRDLAAALREVARVLGPGGLLGIDLVPDLPRWDEYRRQVRLTGRDAAGQRIALVETVRQDRRRGITIFDEEFVTTRRGKIARHRFSLTFRTVQVSAISARLQRLGLKTMSVFGDYGGGPWSKDADTWLLLARKRGKPGSPSDLPRRTGTGS